MGALHTPEFWVAVGFLVLVGFLARPATRMITASLDARAERIREALNEATRLREEAQHLLVDYQRKQRDAQKEVDAITAAARAEAERMAHDAAEKLEDSLRRREQLAKDKIAQAEAEALQSVREFAIDVAVAATRGVLAEKLDSGRQTALIDQAIAELPDRLQ
jgi:F-type H+-transporting ATPase subunit b